MISTPLIDAEAVNAVLDEAVVLDARTGPDAAQAYEAGHVRGARWADLESDLSAPDDPSVGGRHPLPPLEHWLDRLGEWGIAPSTPVVVYDAAGGGMSAARAWWMLRAIGHEAVAVVDGGWAALLRSGIEIDLVPTRGEPVGRYPSTVSEWPSVDAKHVEMLRHDPSWRLIDARAPERFRGETEPLDPVAGHIPGAHNLYWRSQLGADGRFLPSSTVKKAFARICGDLPPERVVCYCGSGVTACHLLLAMEACGLTGAKLYVASWSEWCRLHPPGRSK